MTGLRDNAAPIQGISYLLQSLKKLFKYSLPREGNFLNLDEENSFVYVLKSFKEVNPRVIAGQSITLFSFKYTEGEGEKSFPM